MAGASSPPEKFDGGENVDSGSWEKKPAWSIKPPNGTVAEVPVIGGSSSWPPLSDAVRPITSPKLFSGSPITTSATTPATAPSKLDSYTHRRNKPPMKRGHGHGGESSAGRYPSAPPAPPAELLQQIPFGNHHRPPVNRRGNGNYPPPPPPWTQFVMMPPPSSPSPPPAAFIGPPPYVAPPIALPFPGGEMPPRIFYPPLSPLLPIFVHPIRMPTAGYPDYRSMLIKQIDYYFSNDNLCKDVFLRRQMDDQGWVHISVIAGFKKVKEYTNHITNRIQYILDSVRNSDMVEVQGEKMRKRDNWMVWLLPPQANQHGTASYPQSPTTPNYHNLDRMQNVGLKERA